MPVPRHHDNSRASHYSEPIPNAAHPPWAVLVQKNLKSKISALAAIKITFSHFSTSVDLSNYQLANCIRELGRSSLTSHTLAPRIRADAGKPLATWPDHFSLPHP